MIILGGKQPGRQWRNPVSLHEIVSSAVAETDQYTRVNTGKLAEVTLQGAVVADVIHLLAELVDNAASFSPPQTQVDVHASLVGRGIVIEVEDQGIGIDKEPLGEINGMLRRAPDFSVMALSTESRIGLFVVAQLAARHDIRVTLRESFYGGIRAIVLIPMGLVVAESTTESSDDSSAASLTVDPTKTRQLDPMPGRIRTRLDVKRQLAAAPANGQVTANGQVNAAATPSPKAASNGSAPQPAAGGKPPLPRRDRQANIAPQLREDPEPERAEPGPKPVTNNGSPPTAEHFRFTMAALQKGTQRARAADTAANPRSSRPGDET